MTAVFIHGVPDTARVWNPLRQLLPEQETVALTLPGFGTPLPGGFRATKDEYVDWVIGELARLPEPVDLVGHDWGCVLALRVASLRPDLVRSWAAGGGPFSSDYVWHKNAQIWQTPNAGERWMAAVDEEKLLASQISNGVPPEDAAETARHFDSLMKDCILKLYRSALDPFREWEAGLANITAPGLVLWGELDPFVPVEFADRLGAQTRARRVVKFADCGHWWPTQRPVAAAAALEQHWRAAN